MVLDVDKFKIINDTYGHNIGDVVLKEIVQAISHITRDSDKLIRWGGDEFVGIFYGLSEENAIILGEKILFEVANLKISVGDNSISPSVSIGFSYFNKNDQEYTDALKRSDEALYKSKVQGRNKANIIV
ncbi:Diguanylate cyclase DosC [bioreactor metagenome]|uniref:Diguanylate cyclase DosC n=1 Tax=bioreactor metagenome TaxID=1076179 RepID=A0A645BI61_9ZZZZ